MVGQLVEQMAELGRLSVCFFKADAGFFDVPPLV
jgi:hypothetical protein